MDAAYILTLAVIVSTALIGTARWRRLAPPDRVIAILMWLTLGQEGISLAMDIVRGNNMPAFHFYSAIELAMLATYFAMGHQGVIRIGAVACGVAGLIFSAVNTTWLQDIDSPNTYFLLFEASIISVLSTAALFRITLDENARPFRMVQFWLTLGLLLYWTVTFSSYGMMDMLEKNVHLKAVALRVLQGANLLFYSELALLFTFYSKLIPTGDGQ